jgi:protein phosphatase
MVPDSLATPIEPRDGRAARVTRAVTSQHAVHGGALCRIEVAAATACGRQHAVNEDAHTPLDAAGPPFVVADGVGGGAMAELASHRLVAHLHARLAGRKVDAARIEAAMLEADRAIAERIAQLTDAPGAATVVLCTPANLFGTRWLVAWVGDCRAYRVACTPAEAVEPLTRDDTFRHLNETPPPGGSPDDPARMVGNGATSGANVAVHDLAPDDVLALCSDGVHRHLDGDDWTRIVHRPIGLAARAEALVEAARAHGSVDDATVLLVHCSRLVLGRSKGHT